MPVLPVSSEQSDVDAAWNSLSLYYQSMLHFAKKTSLQSLNKKFLHHCQKNSFRVTKHMPDHGKLDHEFDSFEIRKLRDFAAKLQEVDRFIRVSQTHSTEYQNLMAKITRSPLFDHTKPIYKQLDDTLYNLEQARTRNKKDSIHKWRCRMQSSASKCYKWLKKFTFTPFQGLISLKLNRLVPTACINDSLLLIRDHWRLVWHRELSLYQRSFQRIDHEISYLHDLHVEPVWSPMSHWHLHETACKMRGKAAGPDAWSGTEVAPLPPEAFQAFADFCHYCEMAAKLPTSWRCATQARIPKGQKGLREDGARDINGSRPLAIFSVWYRIWASSRLKCHECQSWICNWWPDTAIGGKKGMEIYHALVPSISAAVNDEYLISLDYSLAFDYCHPELALHVLQRLQLPPFMVTMLFDQWSNQKNSFHFKISFCQSPRMFAAVYPKVALGP